MSKAEKFIQSYTNNCFNYNSYAQDPIPWLTPDQALRAVEIAREEIIEQTVGWLTKHAIKYYINSTGFLGTDELVKDYKLIMSMKDE